MRALILSLFFCFNSLHQSVAQNSEKPKLIVLLTIDQLRYDYISKYWSRYSDNGFKKMVSEGFYMANTHFSYMPTFTGVGHATLGTGTTPAIDGIAANTWYDRSGKKRMYCVEDPTVQTIGSTTDAGKYSPRNLKSTTFSDQLKIANPNAKVVGIAIKDRGAILPVGHQAESAYWFDSEKGEFITSSFYRKSLPKWVEEFNHLNLPKKYLTQNWQPLYPIDSYQHSTADNMPFEIPFKGEENAVFPHQTKELMEENGIGLVKSTPYGNTLTAEFAKKAILGENLGKDDITDFLSVSFSSTDYIGHQFGPHSIEIEDTYLRLDRDLAHFITFLEEQIGANNFLIVLTSDHGAADIPDHVKGNTAYLDNQLLKENLVQECQDQFGINCIEYLINDQLYLDYDQINKSETSIEEVKKVLINFLRLTNGITAVANPAENHCMGESSICHKISNGYHLKNSGDLFFVKEAGWLGSYNKKGGTTHGSPFSYDTHIPLIWYGYKTKAGISYLPTAIKDVAPTLSTLMGISYPSGATGTPINTYLESLK